MAPAEMVQCPGCGTPHHRDCWEENLGCTVFGCSHAPKDEPKTTISDEMTGATPPPVAPNQQGNPQPGNVPPVIAPPVVLAPWQQVNQPIAGTNPQRASSPATIRPPSHLILAIVFTLFCCPAFPFGIASIYFALQVEPRVTAGDSTGATDASRKALMWAWITFGVGLPLMLIILAMWG